MISTSHPIKPNHAGETLDLSGKYRFSRFAYIHAVDGGFVIESPFTPLIIDLKSKDIFYLLMVLAEGAVIQDILEPLSEKVKALTIRILDKCHQCKLLTPVDEDGVALEDQNDLQTWEIHDLFFHARSRLGRHFHEFGGTFRFGEDVKPLSAFKDAGSGEKVPLFVPDMERLKQDESSLTSVLERRVSVREYDSQPMTSEELGEFLYRACRHVFMINGGPGGEVCHRVTPSGGGMHPLEVYLMVHECRGIERGAYRYNPKDHYLEKVADWSRDIESMMADAKRSSGIQADQPPILFCFAARFRRTMWKYAGIAYATILKDVGSLYQTFYLVATAMGLAPCGLGSGNSDTFARVIGSRYYDETTVGEFMLGSKPTSEENG